MKKYMVVENFKDGLLDENYRVYNERGRQFPVGLYYCFQLIESNDESLFYEWFKKWETYVDFELFPLD